MPPRAPRSRASRSIDLADDKAAVLQRHCVSRETETRLDSLAALVLRWQAHINLVAPSTLPNVWTRHIADGLALAEIGKDHARWADLGSGGGFPGLVVASALADRPGFAMALVESNGKKAAFLRSAARELALPVTVRAARIEDSAETIATADAVSARALASLERLLAYVAPSLRPDARCYFAKGRDHPREIAEATAGWRFDMVKHDPQTDEGSTILEISNLTRNERSA